MIFIALKLGILDGVKVTNDREQMREGKQVTFYDQLLLWWVEAKVIWFCRPRRRKYHAPRNKADLGLALHPPLRPHLETIGATVDLQQRFFDKLADSKPRP